MIVVFAFNSGDQSNGGLRSCSNLYNQKETIVITNKRFTTKIFENSKIIVVNDYRNEKSFFQKIRSLYRTINNLPFDFKLIELCVINDNYYSIFIPLIKFKNRKTKIQYWIRDTPDVLKERLKMSLFANLSTDVYYLNACIMQRANLFTFKDKSKIRPTKFNVSIPCLDEKSISIKYNKRKVSYIAAFNSKKGQIEFIQNLITYSEYLKFVTFDFYGDQRGPYFKECVEIASKSNLNISFKNVVDDVSEIFEESSVVVLASKNEGMPRVIYEALSNSTPFVSFDVCGVKGSFYSGKEGIIVKQGDYLGLLRGILILLNDYKFYCEVINSIKRRIHEDDVFVKKN